MGGDPIPGPHELLVEWFEEWKARLTKAVGAEGWPHVATKKNKPNYPHGNLNQKRRAQD